MGSTGGATLDRAVSGLALATRPGSSRGRIESRGELAETGVTFVNLPREGSLAIGNCFLVGLGRSPAGCSGQAYVEDARNPLGVLTY